MHRYFIYLAYNGEKYCGWQIQPNANSVQQEIEKALSTIRRTPTPIVGAGRTDTGVHASTMIAHFDSQTPIESLETLTDKLNRLLPRDIWIKEIKPVKSDAHARFDATSRTYKYYIVEHKDPFRGSMSHRVNHPLNLELMNQAAALLFNYEDFTSFSKLHTDVKTNNCQMMIAHWDREPDGTIVFTVKANRFLRNMVRAIVGTLLDVGRGKITPEDVCKIIEMKDRGKAGTSVPAQALFLVDVEYPNTIFEEQ
ncbi:MAG: tRNA pseudouridine(38-40) synthase TruA [Bacteroidales bacterium]